MFVFKPSCCCCFWSQWKLTEQWLLSLHYVYASELLSTTCHEVRSVWAAVLYCAFQGFSFEIPFQTTFYVESCFSISLPLYFQSEKRFTAQPEALDLSCGLLWGAMPDASQLRSDVTTLVCVRQKNPPKVWMVKGFTTQRCASSYLMCC